MTKNTCIGHIMLLLRCLTGLSWLTRHVRNKEDKFTTLFRPFAVHTRNWKCRKGSNIIQNKYTNFWAKNILGQWSRLCLYWVMDYWKTTDQLISSLKMTNDQWTWLIGLPLKNGGTNIQRDILHVHVLLNIPTEKVTEISLKFQCFSVKVLISLKFHWYFSDQSSTSKISLKFHCYFSGHWNFTHWNFTEIPLKIIYVKICEHWISLKFQWHCK